MNRRASCVGTFEVFEAALVALRTLLAFSQPVNCIFWPIGMLNWLVAASKLHKHRETCCTAEWPFYSFLILCPKQRNGGHDCVPDKSSGNWVLILCKLFLLSLLKYMQPGLVCENQQLIPYTNHQAWFIKVNLSYIDTLYHWSLLWYSFVKFTN